MDKVKDKEFSPFEIYSQKIVRKLFSHPLGKLTVAFAIVKLWEEHPQVIRAYNKFVRATNPRRIDLPAVYGGLQSNVYKTPKAFIDDVLAVMDDLPAHLNAFASGAVLDDVERVCKHLRVYFIDLMSECPGYADDAESLRKQREEAIDQSPEYVSRGYISLKNIHARLTKRRTTLEVNVFMRPVDTDIYTDYLSRVATPMDLGTIEGKLRQYKTIADFAKDVRLVLSHCLSYNADIPENARIRGWAESMRDSFERILSMAIIDAMEKRTRASLVDLVRSESFYVACGGEKAKSFGSDDEGDDYDPSNGDGDYEEEDEHVAELKRFMLQERMAEQRAKLAKTNAKATKVRERELAQKEYRIARRKGKAAAIARALGRRPKRAEGERAALSSGVDDRSGAYGGAAGADGGKAVAAFSSFKMPSMPRRKKRVLRPSIFIHYK